ncbi:unnamed protein product, partial [Meganyctiphanes norvegica]
MAASMASVARSARLPVVVVLGATGAGKSKLALELASKFKGEIISADSMQVYKDLDIITNKVTPEEQALVPHHILDFVDPLSRYTVVDFRNQALPLVEQLLDANKIPVVVGGTNYYIEALLWENLVDPVPEQASTDPKDLLFHQKTDCSDKRKQSCDLGSESDVNKKSKFENDGKENGVSNVINGEKNILCEKSHVLISDKSNKTCSISNKSEDKFSNNSLNNERENNSINSGSVKTDIKFVSEIVQSECESFDLSEVHQDTTLPEIVQSECENFNLSEVHQDTTLPTDLLYKRLQVVDPDIASQYHPNNRRKIIRSLQVFQQTGRLHSELLSEQHSSTGGSRHGGALRYSNAAIFWVTCDQEILDNRVNGRVDEMIERGLVQELEDFHSKYNSTRLSSATEVADYSKGIYQSIGFKEFHNYLLLSEEERKSELGKKLYTEGVADVKLRTRQYARRQIRWIRNRFLVPSGREIMNVFPMSGCEVSCWGTVRVIPAEEVLQSIIDGKLPERKPEDRVVKSEAAAEEKGDKTFYRCEICDRVIIGKLQWEAHMNGARHKKIVNKKKREEAQTNLPHEVECKSS